VLDFAQQDGQRRGGHTWWVPVAGEGPDEEPHLARAAARPPSRRYGRERERANAGGNRERDEKKQGANAGRLVQVDE
jgi:hypothetical protein